MYNRSNQIGRILDGLPIDPRLLILPAGLVVVALLFFAGGGSVIDAVVDSPETAVKGFVNAMNEGNGQKALDFVCGDMVLPASPPKNLFQKVGYETLDNDGKEAHVRFMGEIRVPVSGTIVKKTLDFTVTLGRWQGKWCISKETAKGFAEAFLVIR